MATLAVAAFAAGCGDEAGGEEVTVTTSSLSKAQYIKQAEKICVNGDLRTLGKVNELVGTNPSPQDLEEATTTLMVPNVESQIDELESLGAPKGDEAKVETLLTAMQEGLEGASRQSPEEFVEGFEQFDRMGADYGFSGCLFLFRPKQ